MARTGRPKPPLVLSEERRMTLKRLVKRRESAQVMALRAGIVPAGTEGATNQAWSPTWAASTVTKGRNRFVAHRLKGLIDECCSGLRPQSLTRRSKW